LRRWGHRRQRRPGQQDLLHLPGQPDPQHHAAGESPRQAVRSGVASSQGGRDPTIKQFGVGLSVAVLLASAMVLSLAPAMPTTDPPMD
ncbi:MAG TPA: hypothetical protein VG411_09400, partial [Actinomycetota bacterium]|nr:hypothetical protein [Actinomycetota bacterium]